MHPEEYSRVMRQMTLLHYRNADGNLYVRYLYWNGSQWNWNYNYLVNDWNGNNPAAVPSYSLYFSPII